MPTFTGSRHSGGVSSYTQSSRRLNVDGTPFGTSDFNVPRIVAIFSSSNNFKGFAYVRRRVDNNTIELESNPFDPITNLDINVVGSDNYNTSLNFSELAGGGVSVTNTEVNVTDAIVFGTAGNERSLCFYDEEKDVRQAAGGVWLLEGGVTIFGHLLDRASGAFQAPVNISFTGNSHRFRANNTAAHFAIYGGTVYAEATPAYFGGNGGSAAGTFLVSRTVFSQMDLTSRGAGAVWLQNAERHVLRNVTNTVSANNAIAVRWGDGSIEGGLFKLSGASSLSVFGADADGTYFIGAPADQRITIPEVGDGTSTKPGLWRTGNSARVITVEYTNVVTANKDHNAGSTGNPGPNLNAIFKYRDSYQGGVNGTNILIKNSGGTTVASGVSNGIDPVLLEVIESTVVGETVTVVENNWQWGSHAYGKNIISGTFSTEQVATISGNANNVSHAQRLLQSDNVSVTESRTTVENYPISISLNASTITVTGNSSTVRDMDAIQFYDLMELYLTENYNLETATFVDRAGNSVDTKNRDVVFNFIDYTGSLEANSSLTLNNNSEIQSGTYANNVITPSGKTFTGVIIPSGSVLQVTSGGTVTLDSINTNIHTVQNTSGQQVTVVLTNGASIPNITGGNITIINDMIVNVSNIEVGDRIKVIDNNNTTQIFTQATSTTFQFNVTRENQGEQWRIAVDRAGYSPYVANFTIEEGTTQNLTAQLNEYKRAAGGLMYSGTNSSLVDVDFEFSPFQATITLNGTATPQQIFDKFERELLTTDGMSWSLRQGTIVTQDDIPGVGPILFMQGNIRLFTTNLNGGVAGYVLSTDGVPVDPSSNPIGFVGGLSQESLAGAVWDALLADHNLANTFGNFVQNISGGGGGGGVADWTAAEKEQIRSALGVNGTKTTATGGQLQNKLDASSYTAPDNAGIAAIPTNTLLANDVRLNNLDATISSRSTFNSATDQVVASNMRGTDGANTVAPDNSAIASILADTNELQQNQGDWATATGFSTFNPDNDTVARVTLVDTTTLNSDMRGTNNALLASDSRLNRLDVNVSTRMATFTYTAPDNTSISNILADTNELQQNQNNWITATGFSTFNASTDEVTVSINNDKSGYSLANNSITSSTVANNAFNNNTFTTGFYNQIGSEMDDSLSNYDVPSRADINAGFAIVLTAIDALPESGDITTLLEKLELLEKYHDNTTAYLDATGLIEVAQQDSYFMVVYDNDGTTELKRIAFQNSAGAAALITEATRYVKV